MRKITWNKLGRPLCLFCNKNTVERGKELRRCEDCKTKHQETASQGVTIGKRQPAAIMENEAGEQIAVDKFGKPVHNHGYDIKNDPRGWDKTGTRKTKRTIV